MSLTSAQQAAIAARGNVLVVAGAGTGKTRTLVERCLDCLLTEQPPVSLEEILMVTFTEAAAAEMRQRIRARLEQELSRQPDEIRWQEQLALFDTAHIGTLHSFCLQLVRQHFYELNLDPQLSVLPEEEARLLADEKLDEVLQKHYAGRGKASEAVQQLIQAHGRGSDRPIRALVLRLHHYTQTLPDPAGWLREQLERFESSQPAVWEHWLLEALADWCGRWLPVLEQMPRNELAAKCVATLQGLDHTLSRTTAGPILEKICSVRGECPPKKKTELLKPLKDFLAEADFLASLMPAPAGGETKPDTLKRELHTDPLAQDWQWVRSPMATLLRLAQEFEAAYTEAKRELGMVDFHDLEQGALKLLWDTQTRQPTRIAQQWRQKFRFVFVDEYQDINAAQDKIIECLSRDGARSNRFLVGDIKQSIYRFRLADPRIFQNYVASWRDGREAQADGVRPSSGAATSAGQAAPGGSHAPAASKLAAPEDGRTPTQGQTIPLVDNFRSRASILSFINSLFEVHMRRELGGVVYDEETKLTFGAPEDRRELGLEARSTPDVELHLRVKGGSDGEEPDEENADGLAQVMALEEAEKEARALALRLRELKAQQHPVWDEAARRFRPVEWRDMAVLLRSPANKSESYAKEFARLNVPLLVERGGFYESLEVTDLLSLLQILDNPLQDLPVLAVLHSPLVGLTLNELATIRIGVTKAPFWTALVLWHEAKTPREEAGNPQPATRNPQPAPPSPHAETLRKITVFLDRFARWRRLARQASLSRCLEAVLSETHYAEWLLTQPRGEQRHANVQRLVALAQQFDQFQRQGLFRFLRFIEAQQAAETEPDVAAVTAENAVRLMSIHQSKGLEFPVVVVADLGKPFNFSDLRADVILDEVYGLCPQIKPPDTGNRYPSLPYWLACRRQHRELLGEELRLLYVAMTRARDTLLLSGSISQKKCELFWPENGAPAPLDGDAPAQAAALRASLSARCYADWLGLWFARQPGQESDGDMGGRNAFLRWRVHDDSGLLGPGMSLLAETAAPEMTADESLCRELHQRLTWRYPFAPATRQAAKTSVTAVRRGAAEAADEETTALFAALDSAPRPESPQQELRLDNLGASKGDGGTVAPKRNASGILTTAADVGSTHHLFLQLVSLERVSSTPELEQEAERLRQEQVFSAEQLAQLDFKGLAAFWNSELGRRIRQQRQFVRRELAFTARFSPQELAAATGQAPEPGMDDEFVVVQGVADLVVMLPREIWLVDFKTDRLAASEVADRVRAYEPQLKLYARALGQIYRRPVSEGWLYFLARQEAARVGMRDA